MFTSHEEMFENSLVTCTGSPLFTLQRHTHAGTRPQDTPPNFKQLLLVPPLPPLTGCRLVDVTELITLKGGWICCKYGRAMMEYPHRKAYL